MTVERSQEAVEAAVEAASVGYKKAIRLGVVDRESYAMRAALASADAVDPCVPVRVLREWVETHAWTPDGMEGRVVPAHLLIALLDEHANERTDT